jgi:RNA polymerase sigma factor (sigma-70 family)
VDELSALVNRARSADLEAFGELVRRFQDMAYGCAYAVLGDFHLAEDAAQEAFLEAYRSLSNLAEPKAFPGWLRRIVLRCSSRITRRKSLSTTPLEAAENVPGGEPDPASVAEKIEMKDKVLAAIKALPASERMVTTLFYINGYSQKDIARFLEVPVTTVKNRLHASRKRLKERMLGMVDKTLKSFPLPADFADVVVRQVASEDDLQGAKKYLAPTVHGKKHPETFESVETAQQANIYVVGAEGEVESAGYFDETSFSIGSTILRAVRPREMSGESAVPGLEDWFIPFVKGFRGCFKMAKEKGISLSVVHGSQYDHAFCGFVPCFYYPVVTLPVERARNIITRAKIIKAKDGEIKLAREAYRRDPYAPKMSAYIGGGKWHIIKQDGSTRGYVRVNPHFVAADYADMPFGYVTDMTAETRDAALAIIRLAAELVDAAGGDEICLMQSHKTIITQTMLSLGGKYLLRPSCDLVGLDAEMVAIIDLVGLTKELKSEFQSRLRSCAAQSIKAAFSIEMSGTTVGFVAENGRLKIVSEKERIHRVLPRWIVTRLYVGYYSGEEVLAMGPIPYDRSDGKTPDDAKLDMKELHLPRKEAALFKALFPKMWPVSWPDPDVWPWVIGEEHPQYQAEELKTPEMKAQIDALRFPWIGY